MTLTFNQQQKQNVDLLNYRLGNSLTETEVLEFCKRAKIKVVCNLIDSEVQEEFYQYYGILLNYNINSGDFEAIRL